MMEMDEAAMDAEITILREENHSLRRLLKQVSLVAIDPDRGHVDRCVEILRLVGPPDGW